MNLRPVLIAAGLLATVLPLAAQDPSALRQQLEAGEAEAVLAAVRSLVRAQQDTLDHVLVGSEAALFLERWNDARGLADEAEAKAPDDSRSYTLNGHALWGMAQKGIERGGGQLLDATLADAAWHYAEARKRGGDVYQNAFWEAEVGRYRARTDDALVAVDAALAARPNDQAAGVLRAQLLIEGGRAEEAVRATTALLASHPDSRAIAGLALDAQLLDGRRKEIRRVFLDLAPRHPDDSALFSRLFNRFSPDRPDTWLREILESAVAATPGAPLPLWWLGYLHETVNEDSATALELYRRFAALQPTVASGPYHVGRMLIGLGRLDEARVALLKAHALGGIPDEEIGGVLSVLVGRFVERNAYDKAAALQTLVAVITPTIEAQLNLGVLHFNAGDRERGLRIYRQVLARDDLSVDAEAQAWNYLGLGLWGSGRDPEAEQAFAKSLSVDETDRNARENLGILLLEQDRQDEAERHLRRVLQQEPQRDRSLYHLLRATRPGLIAGSGT